MEQPEKAAIRRVHSPRTKMKITGFTLFSLAIICLHGQCFLFSQQPQRLDLLLRGGLVHDGSGAEPQIADVGVRDGVLVAIGQLAGNADMIVDCSGLVVCPGFIDLHSHSDNPILEPRTRGNVNYLMQGCTTVVTGNCGMGPVDVGAYLKKVDSLGAGTHIAHLLPHGSLRDQAMGKERREPTAAELQRMRDLADQAMRDGAFGMSTGLIYVPGMFSKTDELVEIAKVIHKHEGIYASHIRGEGTGLLDSLQEALQIGKRAEIPVHVSHLKASGKQAWGSLHLGVNVIEQARASGQVVTADQYPYAASSTSLEATLLPDWAREGGRPELDKRIADTETFTKLRADVVAKLATANKIMIASYKPRRDWVGRTIDQIAESEKREAADIVLEIERNGGASIVNFSMQEDDVRMAMQKPWVATASDGGSKIPTADRPHPRSFGTFPRKIGRYAREYGLISLPAAIRSATGLPADIIGFKDRGYLRPSMAADICVFDPQTFSDMATFEEPYHAPAGLRYVFVAGVPAVYEGQATGALAGKALRKTDPQDAQLPKPEAKTSELPVTSTSKDPNWAAKQLAEIVRSQGGHSATYAIDFATYRNDLKNLPIGVFDSGVGGLTVLETLLSFDEHHNATGQPGADGTCDFQNERFVYLGDQANMPYGNYAAAGKEDYLRELILKDAMFLLGNRYWPEVAAVAPVFDKPPVKAIVIACNTATAYGLEDIRAAIKLWDIPVMVVGVVEAGAESVAQELTSNATSDAVAVMATVGTCSSGAYPKAIARAVGIAGKRQPTVWQQGSLGLASAIEGNTAFVGHTSGYQGPSIDNQQAPLDVTLSDVYQFQSSGMNGDASRPETWKLNSVENYVRYEVCTLVENYRRSGAKQPLGTVILGCTHFPFETERIQENLRRLREYRSPTGEYPYRDLIRPEVSLIDPGQLTAKQLYRQLLLKQWLVRGEPQALPKVENVFVSVVAPTVAADSLIADGGFSYAYKYSRAAGRFEFEDTRVVPLTQQSLPKNLVELLSRRCPNIWRALVD